MHLVRFVEVLGVEADDDDSEDELREAQDEVDDVVEAESAAVAAGPAKREFCHVDGCGCDGNAIV